MAVGHPQVLMHVGLVDENDTLPDEAALAWALLDHADTDRAICDDVLEAISIRLAVVAGGSTAALGEDRRACDGPCRGVRVRRRRSPSHQDYPQGAQFGVLT